MKIFLICSVRNATKDQKRKLSEYVSSLEVKGNKVHYPARDKDQNDRTGYRICTDNKNAIYEADEIHIFYDPASQGSLFDLGMAFAFNKPLKIANINDVHLTPHKSFSNMVLRWSGNLCT